MVAGDWAKFNRGYNQRRPATQFFLNSFANPPYFRCPQFIFSDTHFSHSRLIFPLHDGSPCSFHIILEGSIHGIFLATAGVAKPSWSETPLPQSTPPLASGTGTSRKSPPACRFATDTD